MIPGHRDHDGVVEPPAVELVTAAGFDAFYRNYPRPPDRIVSRAAAWRVWRRRGLEPRADEILRGLEVQRPHLGREGGRWVPEPARWLREGRWTDDPPAARAASGIPSQDVIARFVARRSNS